MSYILEALRRSQQERELGQVPTLDTTPFPSETARAYPNPWIMAAVGLAMLAVIIALYAALRGSPPESALKQEVPKPSIAAPASSASPVQSEPEVPSESLPPLDPEVAEEPGSEVEPARQPSPPAEAPLAPPRPEPVKAIPKRSAEEKIPEDLLRDIEAFKDEVRQERSGAKPKRKGAAQGKKTHAKVPPQELRLPSDVKQRLPAFLMSVHLYDKDKAKRFVMINTLKHREGERSPEGITVEEILPDGAVLSFEGHSFFRER